MKEIIVTSQAELDALPIDFDGRIIIKFGTPYNRAVVNRRFRYRVVAWENSSVVAWGNSSVEAWGNSSVVARENSSVVAWENSSVVARENSSVVAKGNTQVVDATNKHKITVSGNARIVYNPRNIEEYLTHYGLDQVDGEVKLYKAVHKRDGRYFSDNDSGFEYVIGEEAVADRLDSSNANDCDHGIHMAYKEWALDYGRNWDNLAILEVEAVAANIVVPLNGSGKVRTDRVKVLREVPLEECGLLGKVMAKKQAEK